MSFNPNQLLNNSLAMLNNPSLKQAPQTIAKEIPAPAFDEQLYANAYIRLGMLGISNIADIGCGAGRFAKIMRDRQQNPSMYLGIDSDHEQIAIAKAAYPNWNFLYGDIKSDEIKNQYYRFDGYLLLNILDTQEEDLEIFRCLPYDKAILFSMRKTLADNCVRCAEEQSYIYERYSSLISISGIGSFNDDNGNSWFMVQGKTW